jgi:microcystin degradation protein MlrC
MGGEYLHAEELKKMITHDLEFAFMATCHDPIAAKVFLTAGAKQVISVHQSP